MRAAGDAAEREALAGRYDDAVEEATSRGCEAVVREFEAAMAGTRAVIARPLGEADRLASSDRALYSTYYRLLEAEVILPSGDKWDLLRHLADGALFFGYQEEIRFAALTLDGVGLSSYGECSLVLKEEMIAHRASILEDNSALLMARKAYNLSAGWRAIWDDRALLCVVKLASQLQKATIAADFPALLLRSGATPEEDQLVEVHIWGPMTRWTLEKVVLSSPGRGRKVRKSLVEALRFKLRKVGVDLEIRS